MNRALRGQAGFGLIEVLIAAVVVAVGLLSVASLHSRLVAQSSDSKARAEAVALAQARIEDLRNYTNQITSRTEFDAEFAATAGFGNDTAIDGVNALFTRSEAVGDVGAAKQIQVLVTWTDAAGVDRDVTMATRLVWESPKTVGDVARVISDPKISGPTGRARIGEGEVPADIEANLDMREDGTKIWDDGSGDLKLVVDGRVVLTLLQACQVDEIDGNACLEFVTINGRVYIDTATQNNLPPGKIHVIASDASFCQRYYMNGGDTVVIEDSTTSAATTDNGQYEYFDYRCYVGGGWYGNIGILLSDGIKQSDKVCLGDPTATEKRKEPVIAARRAYRGMLRRWDQSTGSYVENADGDPVYFTVGIGDGVELPDPSYPEWDATKGYDAGDVVVYDNYEYRASYDLDPFAVNPQNGAGLLWTAIGAHGTHDFVIASLSTSHTAGSYCITDGVMVRTDAYVDGQPGELFAGTPNDFVCLNPDHTDAFPADYDAPITCPYPPTNGPANKHTLTGVITLDHNDSALAELISVQTSDGADTCTRETFVAGSGSMTAHYSCDIYEWGEGWNGFVMIKPNSYGALCTDGGADGTEDNQLHLSGIGGDTSGQSFYCDDGEWALITGTVLTSNLNDTLSEARVSSSGGASDGWCAVAADGLSYACTTGLFSGNWSGSVTMSTTGGVICGPDTNGASGTVSFSNVEAGEYERNIAIKKNSNQTCPL